MPWAELRRRVFADDVLQCPCGGRRSVLAVVTDPAIARRLLVALDLPRALNPELVASCSTSDVAAPPGSSGLGASGSTHATTSTNDAAKNARIARDAASAAPVHRAITLRVRSRREVLRRARARRAGMDAVRRAQLSVLELAAGEGVPSIVIADVSGVGRPDVVIAHDAMITTLLNTNAAGSPTPSFAASATLATDPGAGSVIAGDLDGDGRPDLGVVLGSENAVAVLVAQ